MVRIIDILRNEYSSEYFYNGMKKYTTPKIYPKIVTSKPASSFSQKEIREILNKYPRWYIYYSFFNPEEKKFIRQPPIYYNLNKTHKNFKERLKYFKITRNIIEKLLEDGYSPYKKDNTPDNFSIKSTLKHVLALKKLELKKSSYDDYETRTNHFLGYLKNKGIDKTPITNLEKKTVTNYLNHVLRNSSASNRNNTKTVLSALFTKLVNESFIKHNFIKEGIPKLKSKPKKNTAFTQDEVKRIFEKAKKEDIWLYYFLAHVYYGLFRNVEVVRIKIPHINLKDKLIYSDTKTTTQFKQIPDILIEEFYSKFDFSKYPKNYFVFTKDNEPSEWLTRLNKTTGKRTVTEEKNRRGYWGKRFTKVIRKPLGFSEDYTIYSLRHSAIGKFFLEKTKEYKEAGNPNFEEKALEYIRSITDHQDNDTVRKYLREIGYYLIDDWSDILK